MTVLASDSFNRANSTSGLGTTDSYAGGTSYTWSTITGGSAVWGISSNQAYTPTSANDSPAVIDTGQSDNVQIQVDLAVTSGIYPTGLAFRVSNNNNYFRCYATTANVKVDRMLNGTVTNIVNQNFTTVTTPFTLAVTLSGSTITVFINGTQVATVTDSNLTTNTKHGMYIGNGTTPRLDNFQISSTGSSGTTYSGGGTASGVGSASDTNIFTAEASGTASGIASAIGTGTLILPATGTASGTASVTGNGTLILPASGTASGVGSATGNGTLISSGPTTYSGSGTASGVASATGNSIMVMVAGGTASGISSAVGNATGTGWTKIATINTTWNKVNNPSTTWTKGG